MDIVPSITAAATAAAASLESLGLLRNGQPGIWLKLGLGLVSLAAIRKASSLASQAKLNNYTKDSYDWPNELVVVTGGCGGLGSAVVQKLAKHGTKVISLDIIAPAESLPANVHYYQVDITNKASVKEIAAQIRKEHGDPTVLVNNAAVTRRGPFLDKDIEHVRKVFDVNLISNFTLIQEFLPAMIKRNHGHIVAVSSMAAFGSGPHSPEYACTKVGQIVVNDALAQELRYQYNAPKVRTSTFHPSFIWTPLVDKEYANVKVKPNFHEAGVVAEALVQHILSGNSNQVYHPPHMALVTGIRGWPFWLQEKLRDTLQMYTPSLPTPPEPVNVRLG